MYPRSIKSNVNLPAFQTQNFQLAKKILTQLLSVIVLATIAATAWKLNQKLDLTGSMLSVAFVTSTVLAIGYRLANPTGWALVLRGLGYPVNCVAATRIWLHAESRRWLPGGVWGYASRAVASKELCVPASAASASMLVELLLTILAAGIVSVIGLACCWQSHSVVAEEILSNSATTIQYLVIGIISMIVLVAIVFCSRSLISRKIHSLAKKASALRGLKIQPRLLLAALGYFTAMSCLNGLVNQSLLVCVDQTASVPIVAMIAATALAWLIGFFAFFSPGGILVREAALAMLLLPWMPYEVGFSLAILSRFAQLIAEVVGMVAAVISTRQPKNQTRSRTP